MFRRKKRILEEFKTVSKMKISTKKTHSHFTKKKTKLNNNLQLDKQNTDKPNQSKAKQSKAKQTKPNQTKPNQTKSNQTKPNCTSKLS